MNPEENRDTLISAIVDYLHACGCIAGDLAMITFYSDRIRLSSFSPSKEDREGVKQWDDALNRNAEECETAYDRAILALDKIVPPRKVDGLDPLEWRDQVRASIDDIKTAFGRWFVARKTNGDVVGYGGTRDDVAIRAALSTHAPKLETAKTRLSAMRWTTPGVPGETPASKQMMTAADASKKWGADKSTVTRWCKTGKVPGATVDSHNRWTIPANAVRPKASREPRASRKPKLTTAAEWECPKCSHETTSRSLPKCSKCGTSMTRKSLPRR